MPHQVDGALVHAMSGNELSRVRTEFRLRPPEPINQCLFESSGPTLLCNQVKSLARQMFGRCAVRPSSPIDGHALGTAFVLSFGQRPQREYSRLRMVRSSRPGYVLTSLRRR
jgi:hypothetical protein